MIWLACVIFIVLFGGGFWWGWFVRGWEVKKLRRNYKKLIDHALQSGWIVSPAELIQNLFKVGIYTPDTPAAFSDAGLSRPSQADVICDLLEKMKNRKDEE